MSEPNVSLSVEQYNRLTEKIQRLVDEQEDVEKERRIVDSIKKDIEAQVFPMAEKMFRVFFMAYLKEIGLEDEIYGPMRNPRVEFKCEYSYDEWRYGEGFLRAEDIDVTLSMELSKHQKAIWVYFTKIAKTEINETDIKTA